MIQTVQHPVAAEWLVRMFGAQVGIDSVSDLGPHFIALGILKDRKPIGGVVFTEYRKMPHGSDIRIFAAGLPGTPWMTKKTLHDVFSIPFRQLDCIRVTSIVSEKNRASADLQPRLGFRREGVARRGADGKTNAIIFGMLKTECKWLREDHHG